MLTVDLVVPGAATARPLPDPTDTAVVDDLAVSVDLTPTADGLTAALTIRRDGTTVEPDPYLGARGHLVAIDADNLGYLHVHPDDGDGPVSFTIASPAPGRYRLFFDFSVGGTSPHGRLHHRHPERPRHHTRRGPRPPERREPPMSTITTTDHATNPPAIGW